MTITTGKFSAKFPFSHWARVSRVELNLKLGRHVNTTAEMWGKSEEEAVERLKKFARKEWGVE